MITIDKYTLPKITDYSLNINTLNDSLFDRKIIKKLSEYINKYNKYSNKLLLKYNIESYNFVPSHSFIPLGLFDDFSYLNYLYLN